MWRRGWELNPQGPRGPAVFEFAKSLRAARCLSLGGASCLAFGVLYPVTVLVPFHGFFGSPVCRIVCSIFTEDWRAWRQTTHMPGGQQGNENDERPQPQATKIANHGLLTRERP